MPTSLRLPFLVLAALSVLSLSAHAAELTEKFTRSHPLAAGGTVSLSNLNGRVEIAVWERDEVRIEAEKYARDADQLARIAIEIDAQADRITIKSKHPRDGARSWWGGRRTTNSGGVRYKVLVPASLARLQVDVMNSNVITEGVRADVKIATMNGRIEARGLVGNASLDTMNGRIFASFAALRSGQKISLDTMNGSCTLELPENAGARVRASTMNGRVKSELPITVERSSRRSLRGTLGDGSASIVLDSMNGSLTLRGRS